MTRRCPGFPRSLISRSSVLLAVLPFDQQAVGVRLDRDEVGAVGEVRDVERLSGEPLEVGVAPSGREHLPRPDRAPAAAGGGESDRVRVPLGTGSRHVDRIRGSQTEARLLAADDLGLVRGEQGIARELLEVPVLMSRAGVVHQVACRGPADRLSVRVEVLPAVHDRLAGPAEPLDDHRRRSLVPYGRTEVEEVAVVLALMVDRDAPGRERDQVGPDAGVGVGHDRHRRRRHTGGSAATAHAGSRKAARRREGRSCVSSS